MLLVCQERLGSECLGVVPAAVKGPKGNQRDCLPAPRRGWAGRVERGGAMKPGRKPLEEGASPRPPPFLGGFSDWRGRLLRQEFPSSVEPAGVLRGKWGRGGQDFGCPFAAVQ